jgi:hypothetical protein
MLHNFLGPGSKYLADEQYSCPQTAGVFLPWTPSALKQSVKMIMAIHAFLFV